MTTPALKPCPFCGSAALPPLPANYIDPEHQGEDLELLQIFYRACQAEGGTADEIHLRGIRAALAARAAAPPALQTDDGDVTIDRWIENRPDWPNGWPCVTQCQLTALIGEALEHWGRPTRPAPEVWDAGEVEELVGTLGWIAAQLGDIGWSNDSASVARAATLLQQQEAPTPAVVPVAVSERLPGEGDCDAEGRCWWTEASSPLPVWVLKVDGPNSDEWHHRIERHRPCIHPTHWLPAHALLLPQAGEVGA